MDNEKEIDDERYHREIANFEEASDAREPVDHEDARVKRIKRKVDLRLSAILALLYCVNQIDRTNLPNA